MKNFQQRYTKLNDAQRQAVDQIDGPVMVVAGPGTGKTELLSLRVANILKQTDSLAENILCLTFTESGAANMRSRMTELMGKDAYKVAVHTFHSFGSEVINTHPDYFYRGAEFRPADGLSTYQILYDILTKLPHDDLLGKKMGEEFTQLKQVQASISDFKKNGLIPDEITRLIRHNEGFIEFAAPKVKKFFADKPSKAMIAKIPHLLAELEMYKTEPTGVTTILPLNELCISELQRAVVEAQTSQKTTAITAWRNTWLEKDSQNDFIFKDKKRHKKLRSAAQVYSEYLSAMEENRLYDYDDMILRVVHALDVFPDVRFNLQEKYQYILVDEFQDTNGAQLRIINSLTQGANDGKPNIMVVGDDDQAIYRFQGAEISNVLGFQKTYENVKVITLKDNYRSTASILDISRQVIIQGEDRLENIDSSIDKSLVAHKTDAPKKVQFIEYSSVTDEYTQLAHLIKQRISAGQSPSSIAILARSHQDIAALLPYLTHQNIHVAYERKENILESEPIKILISLAEVVGDISNGLLAESTMGLPEVLAHPAWGLTPQEIWKISLESYKKQQPWLETMLGHEETSKVFLIANWLVEQVQHASHQPLEYMLDSLFGSTPNEEQYASPLHEYFFSHQALGDSPQKYVHHLNALASLRQALTDYKPETNLLLSDLVSYIRLTQKANISVENYYQAEQEPDAVTVMTAHKAKGLEFETVFIIGAVDTTWGRRSQGRSNRLSYPANIAISPAGDTYDDRLRLFFVAMTRAKQELIISYAMKNNLNKSLLRAEFLAEWQPHVHSSIEETSEMITNAEYRWHRRLTTVDHASLQSTLLPTLKNYRLSVTHLNNFIDITSGGPQGFLLRNLLRFPMSMPPAAALGSAVHKTLQRAHAHFSATQEQKPIEDILYDFETILKSLRLSNADFSHQIQKGSAILTQFLEQAYQDFSENDLSEFDFRNQNVFIGEAHLTGVIDVMNIDHETKEIIVGDYKTGKCATSWNGKTDYEKIKLHKYKQQLMFYKLLVESSREFSKHQVAQGTLIFIEPNETGKISKLNISYTSEELETFKKLIEVVWRHIMATDFPDTSHYDQSYKGILSFEKYLLKS